MVKNIVFTFIADDRPGLIERLAHIVSNHHGNWLESQMNQLAGKFAGIVRVGIADENAQELQTALNALHIEGLTIVSADAVTSIDPAPGRESRLSIIGPDRKGIVYQVSQALNSHHINVKEMESRVTSAPMSGDPMFEVDATIQLSERSDLDKIKDALEDISVTLGIDIEIV